VHKRVLPELRQHDTCADEHWLNLEELSAVEVTSEALSFPIEYALFPEGSGGWRAGGPGPQTIRVHFRTPQRLSRICLQFVESEKERTQQYTLRWSRDYGEPFHEIVRQQWNFSPEGSTCEIEEHCVELRAVTILELEIIPDIRVGSRAVASLAQWRLA
jgi:hypothetical protein